MARTEFYPDRSDGLWTIEVDPATTLAMQVRWTGRYIGVTGVTPQPQVSEGGNVTVSVLSFDDNSMLFKVAGSGATVAFAIAFQGGQVDELTLRFRSVTT